MPDSYSRRGFIKASAGVAAGFALLGTDLGSARLAFASSAKPVSLQWTNRWGKGNDTHYDGMQYVFSTFKKQYPNISIEEIDLPVGPDVTKDLAECQSGACPDMMNDMTETFWADSYLLDFTPYLDADPAWKRIFNQQALKFTQTNGHQWGLCDELSPLDVIWNTKVLEGAGVSELPKSWDQLLSACEKVKSAGKQPASWNQFYAGGHMFHNLVCGQPGGLEALAKNDFSAPQIYNAFEALKTFVDNKWLASDEISQTAAQSFAGFQNDQTAFYMDGIWTIKNDIVATGLPPGLRHHVAFSALPALKGDKMVLENRIATVFGIAAGLKSDPAKLNAALTFAKYLFSQPVAAKWIELCWDTMAIDVPQSALSGLAPLPKSFLAPTQSPTEVFVLPSTPAMQAQLWTDADTALQTLLLGKSAAAAQAAYEQYLAKYTRA